MRLAGLGFVLATATGTEALFSQARPVPAQALIPQEKHLRNIRQLTFEGENAEAYFSFDEKQLVFQSHNSDNDCDQIYIIGTDGRDRRLISTGAGRTTCSYFLPDGNIIYSSTHLGGKACPPKPDMSRGYVWPLYAAYDVFLSGPGGKLIKPLVQSPGYDAEATVSPKGDRIVFTSTRNGDIDLYSCRLDGSDVRQLTNIPGYDGGAFYSLDGKKIVFRASRPQGKELEEYRALLKEGLIRPSKLEIFVMNADGSDMKQVSRAGIASFAPFPHPDGKRIIFSSNLADPQKRNFDLYLIGMDGQGLERVTFYDEFDGFPMFTRNGKTLVFCSNRHNAKPGDTNIFLADWVE